MSSIKSLQKNRQEATSPHGDGGRTVPCRRKVALVYPFFAHYRGAILNELLANSVLTYVLIGGEHGVGGIKPWSPTGDHTIENAPMFRWHGFDLFQPKVLLLPFRRDIDTIIFLGNAKWASTWISAALARLTGKRVLFWTHGWLRNESGLKGFLRRVFYRIANGLLLYGNVAKSIGIGYGFAASRLHVIYNSLDYAAQAALRQAVDRDRLRQIRNEVFGDVQTPIAIFCSRLNKDRRLDLLVEALAILKAQNHPVNLILIGDGPERIALENLASSRGIRVTFVGECYDEQRIGELTMASNVTVAPGKVGLTVMQSLAYGIPVITHDDSDEQAPEWEAIIPGKTGDLFRHNDATDLARVIRQWTSTAWPIDSVAQACVSVIERFYNPQFQRWVIDRAVLGHPADDLFFLREKPPCRTRPTIAYISNGFTHYNVHFLKRVHRELLEIDLRCCYTHEFSMGNWAIPTDELNIIQFGQGQWATEASRASRHVAEYRKAGRIIEYLARTNVAAVIMMGYNDLGRLRIIRWCQKNLIPCYIWGDSNIKSDRATGLKGYIKRLYVGGVARRVTGALACGGLGRAYFRKYGFREDYTFLVPNEPDYSLIESVSDSVLEETATKFSLDRSRRRLMYCGRLVPGKRIDLLIQAFLHIAEHRPDWDLLIVGSGPLRSQLGAMIPENRKSRIIWPGFLGDQRYVSAMYRLADALVLPSDREAWALVINEAACAGLAIVASDMVGAAAELVRDGVNGRVFPAGDQKALEAALLEVTDERNTQAMRAASPRILQEWREKADPVEGLHEALAACGAIPTKTPAPEAC